jgi:hypothetical protein
MTEKEAKELSLKVWEYLANNPEISSKNLLPEELKDRLKGNVDKLNLNWCPLCDFFRKDRESKSCPGCPLETCREVSLKERSSGVISLYDQWFNPKSYLKPHENNEKNKQIFRKKAALAIFNKINAWEPADGEQQEK